MNVILCAAPQVDAVARVPQTDPMQEIVTPPGVAARHIMRQADRTTLATALSRDGTAWPYASLVLAALAMDASPLLLISNLADHTKNIKVDSRVSLLFDATQDGDDRLAGPRLTVMGHARRAERPADLLPRFLRRHPSARRYANFNDFELFQVEMTRAHLVAGFGRIRWLDRGEINLEAQAVASLGARETEIVDHMNSDHRDAIRRIARVLLDLPEADWLMTGIDPDGFDLRSGPRLARAWFDTPVETPAAAREALIALSTRARRADGIPHARQT